MAEIGDTLYIVIFTGNPFLLSAGTDFINGLYTLSEVHRGHPIKAHRRAKIPTEIL